MSLQRHIEELPNVGTGILSMTNSIFSYERIGNKIHITYTVSGLKPIWTFHEFNTYIKNGTIAINKKNLAVKDLDVGDVFLNSNGHLTLVYRITKEKMKVINYNGSIYSISKYTSILKYSRPGIKISPQDFLRDFPKAKLREEKDGEKFETVYSIFFETVSEFNNKLLLLIN